MWLELSEVEQRQQPGTGPQSSREFDLHPKSHRKPLDDFKLGNNMTVCF